MFKRMLDLKELLSKRSYFLFGPRQTGKSWLIRETLKDCKVYNLLDSEVFLKLSQSPARIRQELQPAESIVVIDEIQKLPELLDEVHLCMEEKGIRFLLTGSSARKLRRGGVNLLGGRARVRYMHPLVYGELKEAFDLTRALDIGLLPSIYLSDSPCEDLQSYAGIYLQEEIVHEAAVRSVPSFSRFLTVAAMSQGQIINQTKLASDAQVSRMLVHEYFEILKDTLLGVELPAWKKTVKRKPTHSSKFYFFDIGVARFFQRRKGLQLGSTESGEAFESYLLHEIKTYLDYRQGGELNYWRSTSGFEVDFILSDSTAIEAKAKTIVANHDLKGLRALREEAGLKRYVVASLEDTPRTIDGIEILPWRLFLQRLWEGDLT